MDERRPNGYLRDNDLGKHWSRETNHVLLFNNTNTVLVRVVNFFVPAVLRGRARSANSSLVPRQFWEEWETVS